MMGMSVSTPTGVYDLSEMSKENVNLFGKWVDKNNINPMTISLSGTYLDTRRGIMRVGFKSGHITEIAWLQKK